METDCADGKEHDSRDPHPLNDVHLFKVHDGIHTHFTVKMQAVVKMIDRIAITVFLAAGFATFDRKTHRIGPGQLVFFPTNVSHAETRFFSPKMKYLAIAQCLPRCPSQAGSGSCETRLCQSTGPIRVPCMTRLITMCLPFHSQWDVVCLPPILFSRGLCAIGLSCLGSTKDPWGSRCQPHTV